ncbi:beta-caryophyllene synthase [Tanacetum coccineum]
MLYADALIVTGFNVSRNGVRVLSQKGSGAGRGMKKKQVSMADKSVKENMNDDGIAVGPTLAGNNHGTSSYVNVTGEPSRKALNFHTLFTPAGNGVDVLISVESIRVISERFANMAYGFFLGKRVAYLVFRSMDGLDAMLENGSWFIRNNPLILKKWNPDVNLLKEDVGNVLVWVKLHGFPMTAFSEDGLSVISTKLGTPLMLDFYISDMCIQSWGRSSYVGALIEVRVDVELKDNIMVAMPKLVEEGLYTYSDVVKNIKKPGQVPRGVLVGPKNVDTTPRYKNDNQTGQFGNQRAVNVAGARETIGGQVVQQSRIQCFNCKEFGHYAKECRKPKWVKDSTYHKEKMYNTIPDNVFANDIQHFKQSESISNTCAVETGNSNVLPDSSDMCDNDIQDDQNDVEWIKYDDERVALANLIC